MRALPATRAPFAVAGALVAGSADAAVVGPLRDGFTAEARSDPADAAAFAADWPEVPDDMPPESLSA